MNRRVSGEKERKKKKFSPTNWRISLSKQTRLKMPHSIQRITLIGTVISSNRDPKFPCNILNINYRGFPSWSRVAMQALIGRLS